MAEQKDNEIRMLGEFVLDLGARTLTRMGDVICLTPKEFDTLVFLVDADGKAVEKNELIRAVWKETFVGDGSLARNISVLRRHLGSDAIQTLPRFGYRLALPVSRPHPGAPVIPEIARSQSLEPSNRLPGRETKFINGDERMRLGSRLLIAALVPLVFLGGASVLGPRLPRRPASTPKIAILPLRNRSADLEATNYLRDGFAEEMTSRLSRVSFDRLQVLAKSSSEQYSDTSKPPKQISSELGADYLLDGTIAADRSQLKLKLELINGPDQTILWSQQFEGPLPELSVFEDKVLEAVESSVHIAPPRDQEIALPGDTTSAEAHEAYLQGRYLLGQRTLQSERQALIQFQRAATLDPHYARAFEGISETYIFMGGSVLPERPFVKAKEAALRAISIDGNLSEAHRDLAYATFTDEADISGAEAEYRRAIALNPDDARAHHWYAQLLAAERRFPDSLREAEVGYELDPRSVGSVYNYGFMLIECGQAASGVHVIRELLKREPQNDIAWGYLGAGYALMHEYDKSAEAFLSASRFSAVKVEYRAAYAYALAMSGEKEKAKFVAQELESKYRRGTWVPGQSMMAAYIGLQDRDKQLVWLRRGLADGSIGPFEANTDPIYSATLADSRLREAVGKLVR